MGVFGLLLAFGMPVSRSADRLLFPPIPLPSRVFAFGYAAIELLLGVNLHEIVQPAATVNDA
jgi:rhomboid family protein